MVDQEQGPAVTDDVVIGDIRCGVIGNKDSRSDNAAISSSRSILDICRRVFDGAVLHRYIGSAAFNYNSER